MLPASTRTPTKTPTKLVRNVNISPSSKTKKCIICGKYEWNPDYRRKLFRGQDKTPVAQKIEKTLNVTIEQYLQTEIVCKKCVNCVDNINKNIQTAHGEKLQDLHKKIHDLNVQFTNSQDELLAKYSSVSTKRLQKAERSPTEGSQKRKSLGPLFGTAHESEETYESCLVLPLSELSMTTPSFSQPQVATSSKLSVTPSITARSKLYAGPTKSYQLPRRWSTVATQTESELSTLCNNVWVSISFDRYIVSFFSFKLRLF
jgi:superfamily II DNA helicase RecQ